MTVPVETEDASEQRPETVRDRPTDPGPRVRPVPSARDAVGGVCPYLTSSGGSWRMASPSRDHRCAAVDPPTAQPNDKQRRHCLSSDHVECALFRAARTSRMVTLAGGSDPGLVEAADRRRRPLARTAPILLEPPSLVDRAVRLQLDRAPGQLALIALMVVAFAIVALTRLSAGAGTTASPSPGASAAAVSQPPTPRPTPGATATVGPSVSPSGGPGPSFRTTYKVKKGDTLLTIARHFGTTAAKIKTLNGLTSSTLTLGQVLKIP
jgi:LysM repeat protein